MRTNLISYAVTVFLLLCLDGAWFSLTATPIYKAQLGSLLRSQPALAPAAAFYLMYAVGVVTFAVLPALEQNDWMRALWGGALLGFTAYGAYDLTNQATLVGWANIITVIDMAWGTCATAAGATAAFFITRTLTTHN